MAVDAGVIATHSLDAMLTHIAVSLREASDPPLSPAMRARLAALTSPAEGTLYLERRLPLTDAGPDVIVAIRQKDLAEQCARLAQGCTDMSAQRAWMAVSTWSERALAAQTSRDDLPHHYWFEFDNAAAREHPNLFLCNAESAADHTRSARFVAAVQQLADEGLSDSRAITPLCEDAIAAVMPAGFVSYVGFMLGRSPSPIRICITGLHVPRAQQYVASLSSELGMRLARALGDLNVWMTETPTILHLDWDGGTLARVGVEIGAQRYREPNNQSPLFRALCAHCDAPDRQWLDAAVFGRSVFTNVAGSWLGVARVLNHVKAVVDRERDAPTMKAYVRYDWRSARRAMA